MADIRRNEAIHPIELTVQSLTETPLEILNLNMQSLYESQIILSGTLLKMQEKLDSLEESLQEDDIAEYKKRVHQITEKLRRVNSTLSKVEARVERVASSMGLTES